MKVRIFSNISLKQENEKEVWSYLVDDWRDSVTIGTM